MNSKVFVEIFPKLERREQKKGEKGNNENIQSGKKL